MLKTIKTVKNMRLDELIEYVWDNGKYPSYFIGKDDFYARFDNYGALKLENDYIFTSEHLFEVVEEEKIEECHIFGYLVEVYKFVNEFSQTLERVTTYEDERVSRVKDEYSVEFHALIDGELQKIWERDKE